MFVHRSLTAQQLTSTLLLLRCFQDERNASAALWRTVCTETTLQRHSRGRTFVVIYKCRSTTWEIASYCSVFMCIGLEGGFKTTYATYLVPNLSSAWGKVSQHFWQHFHINIVGSHASIHFLNCLSSVGSQGHKGHPSVANVGPL